MDNLKSLQNEHVIPFGNLFSDK